MSMPHWNMYWSRPTVFRHTDLPPALGPEMSRMCFCGVSFTVNGTISLPSFFRDLSRSGCLALRRSISFSSDIIGIPATKSSDVCALAMRKSSSPMHLAPSRSSGTNGRTQSLKSYSMRAISRDSAKCNSLISLVISTISAGSMKVVLPDEDSSYTKPCSFLLLAELTGMSIFPSRMTTDASLSTMPSLCAFFNMMPILLEMAPSLSLSFRRMSYNSSDAVSLTLPNLSSMESMR